MVLPKIQHVANMIILLLNAVFHGLGIAPINVLPMLINVAAGTRTFIIRPGKLAVQVGFIGRRQINFGTLALLLDRLG